jgi:hypothetical protein
MDNTGGHLLGTEHPRETVEVRFEEDIPLTAHKILWGYQREMGVDFAVLKLATPSANRRPLPISLSKSVFLTLLKISRRILIIAGVVLLTFAFTGCQDDHLFK